MKKQLVFCAALLALGLGAVTTADAQYGPAYPRVYRPGLPAYQVVAIVRSAGMTPLSQPIRRGPNYVVIAGDRAGAQVRVVINGYNGMIMRVRPLVAMRPIQRPYGPAVAESYAPRPRVAVAPPAMNDAPVVYGADPYARARVDDGLVPLPPRSVPNARVATAPNTVAPPVAARHAVASPALAAAPPPRTPLPRPRPALASNESTGSTAIAVDPPAAVPAQKEAWPVPTEHATGAPKSGEAKSGELKMVPVAPLD